MSFQKSVRATWGPFRRLLSGTIKEKRLIPAVSHRFQSCGGRGHTLRSPLWSSSSRPFSVIAHGGSDDSEQLPGDDMTGMPPGATKGGPKMIMMYTCKVCETRAAKTISKIAYEEGVVLIRCPGCENLHLIADRLGWFEDESWDVQKLLAERGEHCQVVTEDNILELTVKDIAGHDMPLPGSPDPQKSV